MAVLQLESHYFTRMYIQDAVFDSRMTRCLEFAPAIIDFLKHFLYEEIILFQLWVFIYLFGIPIAANVSFTIRRFRKHFYRRFSRRSVCL
jgi:hypothetical protein